MASLPSKIDGFNPAKVLSGRRSWPTGSFLQHLSRGQWLSLVHEWGREARTYEHGEHLPLGSHDRTCFIILGGCVLQERYPLGPRDVIARFRGAGQFLGEAKLIAPWSSVTTYCVGTTWVMPCSSKRANELLRAHPQMQLALLRSLEDRNRTDEEIYATTGRSPRARVARLLTHLADTAGTTDPTDPDRITISGLRQRDISRTLQLSTSAVENVLRHLRTDAAAIDSRYRALVVTDPDALERISATE